MITETLRWLDSGAEYSQELPLLEYLRDPHVVLSVEEVNGAVDVIMNVTYDIVRHFPVEPGQGYEVN